MEKNKETIRKVSDSLSVMSELVLPNDTNTHGNLMGGKLMYWMDIAGVMVAQKHCNREVVTVSVDNISFNSPIRLGNLVTIEARITRSFKTSMEVFIRVWGEDVKKQEKQVTNEAFLTFVAMGEDGHPVSVPTLLPETDEEKKDFEEALQRRQLRLVLAGKMKLSEAEILKEVLRGQD